MKSAVPGWIARLASPHRLTPIDLALTLVPALLWIAGVQLRSQTITPWCDGQDAAKCTRASVLPIDQPGMGMELGQADGYSYATQNLSGFVAIGGIVAWNAATIVTRSLSPITAATAVGTDLVLLAQASSWNGALNEISHFVSARPRPFVYSDPATRGLDPAHYTSFYSGHTSFSALAGVVLLLVLFARGAPAWLLALTMALGQSLAFMTGIFRVMAGRHFVTDVVAALLAGAAVAIAVVWIHKRRA